MTRPWEDGRLCVMATVVPVSRQVCQQLQDICPFSNQSARRSSARMSFGFLASARAMATVVVRRRELGEVFRRCSNPTAEPCRVGGIEHDLSGQFYVSFAVTRNQVIKLKDETHVQCFDRSSVRED